MHPVYIPRAAARRYSEKPPLAYLVLKNLGCTLRRVERISVARGRSVPVSFCEDDGPSALFIPKHLAGAFHAFQRRFGSVGKVLDGFRDLGCRHCLAGKRQFTQDQLRYRPSTAPMPRFLGAGCPLTVAEATSSRLSVLSRYGIGRSFVAKDVQR